MYTCLESNKSKSAQRDTNNNAQSSSKSFHAEIRDINCASLRLEGVNLQQFSIFGHEKGLRMDTRSQALAELFVKHA